MACICPHSKKNRRPGNNFLSERAPTPLSIIRVTSPYFFFYFAFALFFMASRGISRNLLRGSFITPPHARWISQQRALKAAVAPYGPPPLKQFEILMTHIVVFCSASRPIPSPSFNTEAVETPRANTISPLRSGQEFDDTYSTLF